MGALSTIIEEKVNGTRRAEIVDDLFDLTLTCYDGNTVVKTLTTFDLGVARRVATRWINDKKKQSSEAGVVATGPLLIILGILLGIALMQHGHTLTGIAAAWVVVAVGVGACIHLTPTTPRAASQAPADRKAPVVTPPRPRRTEPANRDADGHITFGSAADDDF